MQLPAVCPTCGAVVPSGFFIENARNITFKSVGTSCPNGHTAYIPDGIYDAIGGVVTAITHGPLAAVLVQRLFEYSQRIKEGKGVDASEIESIINALPEVAAAPLRLIAKRNPALALTLLFAIYMSLVAGVLIPVGHQVKGFFLSDGPTPSTGSPGITINNQIHIEAPSIADDSSKARATDKRTPQQIRKNRMKVEAVKKHRDKMKRKKAKRSQSPSQEGLY